MDDTFSFTESFPLSETLCKDCAHRQSKTIIPIDPEMYGLDDETLYTMGIGEDDEIIIEQHTCLISNQDMDYIVLECNSYKPSICKFFKNP